MFFKSGNCQFATPSKLSGQYPRGPMLSHVVSKYTPKAYPVHSYNPTHGVMILS